MCCLPTQVTQTVSPLWAWKGRKVNESNSTEWLVQPKRVCQTWFLLLSYLRYKWSRGEETGLISDKTSNPWAPYVEKSIADFERGLTQRAADFACTCRVASETEMATNPACPVHGEAAQSR